MSRWTGMTVKFAEIVLVLMAGLLLPHAANAQAEVYASFSDSVMTNLVNTQYLPGVTVGVLVDGPLLLHHAQLAASIQGRFVESSSTKVNGLRQARALPYRSSTVSRRTQISC